MGQINDRLKSVMDEKNLRAADIVHALGVNRATASAWRNGNDITISAENLYKLAQEIGCSLEWLITGRGTPFLDMKLMKVPEQTGITFEVLICLIHRGVRKVSYQHTGISSPVSFNDAFFESHQLDRSACKMILVECDSMAPYINRGDLVLVDTKDTVPRDGDVYLVAFPQIGTCRLHSTITKADGTLVLRSLNSAFHEESIPKEQIESQAIVIGRVVLRTSR